MLRQTRDVSAKEINRFMDNFIRYKYNNYVARTYIHVP